MGERISEARLSEMRENYSGNPYWVIDLVDEVRRLRALIAWAGGPRAGASLGPGPMLSPAEGAFLDEALAIRAEHASAAAPVSHERAAGQDFSRICPLCLAPYLPLSTNERPCSCSREKVIQELAGRLKRARQDAYVATRDLFERRFKL